MTPTPISPRKSSLTTPLPSNLRGASRWSDNSHLRHPDRVQIPEARHLRGAGWQAGAIQNFTLHAPLSSKAAPSANGQAPCRNHSPFSFPRRRLYKDLTILFIGLHLVIP